MQRLSDAGYKKSDTIYLQTSLVHSKGIIAAGTRGFVEGPGTQQDIESFSGLGGTTGAGIGGELIRVKLHPGDAGSAIELEVPSCAIQKDPLTALQKAQASVDQAFRVATLAQEKAERANTEVDSYSSPSKAQVIKTESKYSRRLGVTHNGAYHGEIETVEKTILSTKPQIVPHGLGIFVFSDGSEYAGEFWHGQKTGHGVFRESMNTSINKGDSKRIIYAGEINNGWKDGFGTWWNQDGTVNYSGEWKAGIPFLPLENEANLQLSQINEEGEEDKVEEEVLYPIY